MSLVKPDKENGFYIKKRINKEGIAKYYKYKQTYEYVKKDKKDWIKKTSSLGSGKKITTKGKIRKLLNKMTEDELLDLQNHILKRT